MALARRTSRRHTRGCITLNVLLLTLIVSCGDGSGNGSDAVARLSQRSTDAPVRVVVWDDENRNEVIDAGEAPRPGTAVSVVTIDGVAVRARTDSAGYVEFDAARLEQSAPFRIDVELPVAATADGFAPAPHLLGIMTPGGTASIEVGVADPVRCAEASAPECAGLELPDLTPFEDYSHVDSDQYPSPASWYLDEAELPGRTLLRVPSASLNRGTGMVHLIGLPPVDATRPVVQRAYAPGGGYIERPVGTFDFHVDHDHVHLDDFERLSLIDSDGRVVAGTKNSFCLTNVLQTPTVSTPATWRRGTLPTWSCGPDEQVIDVGWADYYGAALADQWIDVTDVDPGDYVIKFESDPFDLILESDESNNSFEMPITLD